MFSGIVEEIGTVARIWTAQEGLALTIACDTALEGTRPGDSIAVDGVCLTVAELGPSRFTANVQPVTARLSTLGGLRAGDRVNIERAVAVGQRIGGHYVQGHVDGVGRIRSLRGEGASLIVEVGVPDDVRRYIVARGFVAIDGASLTVMSRTGDAVSVSLVYHTQQHITLTAKRPGDPVNIEADVIARYVESLIAPHDVDSGITLETLRKAGFA